MRFRFVFIILLLATLQAPSQDTTQVRQWLCKLTSSDFFGRGYRNHGLQKSGKWIVRQMHLAHATPVFGSKYHQPFYHNVNVFTKCEIVSDKHRLVPGVDFIPSENAASCNGDFNLVPVDSVTAKASNGEQRLRVVLKKKLTFSVAAGNNGTTGIELDRNRITTIPRELSVRIESHIEKNFESRNLGCMIRGTAKPDSFVVFSAHYDHLGGIDNNVYFPGANDNASGVSMVLSLLKYYSEHPPKYTAVFIFFAGEEAGLLGSKYFTEHSPFDLGRIKFLINLDLLGTGEGGMMVVNGAVYEKEFARLSTINDEKNLLPKISKRGKAANSDHYWFTEKGVPAFFFYTMGGIAAYHDVNDRCETLPLTEFKDIFTLITSFVEGL